VSGPVTAAAVVLTVIVLGCLGAALIAFDPTGEDPKEAEPVHYVCIICKAERPLAEGQPVAPGRFPSWLCRDTEACAARFRAAAGGE
jgi:hypothetical protein